jgi:sulfur-oxidizing protein SoxA
MSTAANGLARRAGITLILFGLSLSSTLSDEIPRAERRSGYAFMSRETQAMQDDRTANPGTLWVLDGEAMWGRKEGAANRSCSQCHGNASKSMRGAAARYPAFDAKLRRPIDLEQRINICRTERQKAAPFAHESKELLALTAYVAAQSKGRAIEPPQDKRLTPFRNVGRDFFYLRQGQLNLSCAQCHNDNWRGRLAGSAITQAHPTGYPLYRLEWQSMGSLQRRLRNCLIGMRAEPFDYGAPDYVALELYLMWRARGMPMETPAVRP